MWFPDSNRGPVLRPPRERHVRRGEGEIHGVQGLEELDAGRIRSEPFSDHGKEAFRKPRWFLTEVFVILQIKVLGWGWECRSVVLQRPADSPPILFFFAGLSSRSDPVVADAGPKQRHETASHVR